MRQRARHIHSLIEQHYYGSGSGGYYYNPPPVPSFPRPQQYHYDQHYDYEDDEEHQQQRLDPEKLKRLEMELRRKNPDTLDKLKFSMSDKKYGKLLALLAKGALIAAAVYAYPYVWGPLFAVGFYAKSRQKNIERRDQGLKPRWYHDIRPDDKY